MDIFEGLVGLVVEESIVISIILGALVIFLTSINSAISSGSTSTAAIIYVIFAVLILTPVIHHLNDLK